MIDILKNVMNIAGRVHDMQIAGTLSMVIFGVVLVFGIMNCVLGYRLLRFWMMIFGFLIGAGIGLFAVYQIGFGEKLYYAVGMIGVGLILAILSFAVFKAGIFIMGAGIGLTLTVYIIHPTTSFSFFICLLAGVGLGMLALRYEREVIIVGTSILGGILSGFATAKLANMEEIPFGIIFSVGFALVGMLIQFAINKPKYEDDYDGEEDEEELSPRKRRKREAEETEPRNRSSMEKTEKGRDNRSREKRTASYDNEEYDFDDTPAARRKSREQRRKRLEDYEQEEDYSYESPEEEDDGRYARRNPVEDLDDDLSNADDEEIDEILDEYGVDEDDVIEEYLEDYYGENKKKKQKSQKPQRPQKTQGKRRNSASPYQKRR
ncbi:TM7S3/TM198-like domain-containing protein [Blautia sp.]